MDIGRSGDGRKGNLRREYPSCLGKQGENRKHTEAYEFDSKEGIYHIY